MSDNPSLIELQTIEVQGTPAQMGVQLGEATREETRELFELRLASALRFAQENGAHAVSRDAALQVARSCLPVTQRYDPVGYEEFLSIARGAHLSPEELYITQGLTDFKDVLTYSAPADAEGCSSFIIRGSRTEKQHLLIGQSWDLQTNNMPYVRLIHRRPSDGSPRTWSLTLTGCLTLIGLNDRGIAVGNTNLKTRDARPGTQYLTVLHRTLRSATIEEAVQAVQLAPRAAAHYYYLGDSEGNAVGLECSARENAVLRPENGFLVHCNHALHETIAALEVDERGTSTACRQERLSALIESHSPAITVATVQKMLSDHANGEDAICRHGKTGEDTSTNACVIMSPQTGEMHACRGQAHAAAWRSVAL